MSAPFDTIQGNRGLEYTREIGSEAQARTATATETATINTANQSVAINPATTYITISGTSGSLSTVTGVTTIGQTLTIVWGSDCTVLLDDQPSSNFAIRNGASGWPASTEGTVAVLLWDGSQWLEMSRSVK